MTRSASGRLRHDIGAAGDYKVVIAVLPAANAAPTAPIRKHPSEGVGLTVMRTECARAERRRTPAAVETTPYADKSAARAIVTSMPGAFQVAADEFGTVDRIGVPS